MFEPSINILPTQQFYRMKQLFQLSLLALTFLLGSNPASATIYVKATATGSGDGSSWANAFTTLDPALAAAAGVAGGEEIWVAAGTYKPATTVANNVFSLTSGTRLYGGFAGTETSLSQRNLLTNVTTLSGDLTGDDITGDFTQKRTDNSRHVILVANGTLITVVDAFVIKGGQTLIATADPTNAKRGGGILAQSKLKVTNCTFKDNYGLTGAALAVISANASGMIVSNCSFDANLALDGAVMIVGSTTAAEVNKCEFKNNTTNRGCLYLSFTKNSVVDSCIFENNKTGTNQWGAGIYNYQSSYTLTNSTFKNNQALNAAGIYNDGRDGGNSCSITNCLFEGNTAVGYGGTGIFNFSATIALNNCTFNLNVAPTSATAMYSGGTTSGTVTNCLFSNGSTNFGGAVSNYNTGGSITYTGCTFANNNANTSGGAVNNGFVSSSTFKNCIFDQNNARFGGAIACQNDSTILIVDSCTFSGNTASDNGGSIRGGAGINITIDHSLFYEGSADFGGAIELVEDSLELAVLKISNSSFHDNFVTTQAGAINLSNADVELTNCLFYGNINSKDGGVGGVISNNASGTKIAPVKAVNCTFAGNEATIGAGIAQWEESDSASAVLTLQNCVFANPGNNYMIEFGNPEVISSGGNLSTDATLLLELTAAKDLNVVDPLFVDLLNYDFHLSPISPCIDGGIAAGAPTVDIDGKVRVGAPDKGSYEFGTNATHSPNSKVLPIDVSPNPTTDFIQVRLENEWNGPVSLQIINAAGVAVQTLHFEKTAAEWQTRTNVTDLPGGAYFVRVQMGNQLYSAAVVKQ